MAPSSVYRHACRDGWTKKGMGDARARAHARMVEEDEAAFEAARRKAPGWNGAGQGAVPDAPV